MAVKKDMLSNCCENIREKYYITIGQDKNLIPTLADKQNYVTTLPESRTTS